MYFCQISGFGLHTGRDLFCCSMSSPVAKCIDLEKLYFCLCSEKCMHKCNSLLTVCYSAPNVAFYCHFLKIYKWCSLSCYWLIGHIREGFYRCCVIIIGKLENVDFKQVLWTSWVSPKWGIKSCAVYKIDENIKWNVAASHSDLTCELQLESSLWGLSTAFGGDLAGKLTCW